MAALYGRRHTSFDNLFTVTYEKEWQRGRNMIKPRRKRRALDAGVTTVVVLRLYIAGGAPNSRKAIANLEAICEEHLKGAYKLEVVDVLEHPRLAMAEGVLVTPSVAKVSPLPNAHVVGNLSDKAKVLAALGLKRTVGSRRT
jgi:circadian clock protein KaiB